MAKRLLNMAIAGSTGASVGAALMGGPDLLWGVGIAGSAMLAGLWFQARRGETTSQEDDGSHDSPASKDTPTPQQAEAAARELLATMSHEIRTPLNGVLGMVQLLHGTELSREQRGIVQTILDSGHVLSQIVDDYLTYYRFESGQGLSPSPSPCQLDETVLQTILLFQGLAYEKGLQLTLLCDPDVPHIVRADASRLGQVVANLVLNAIKYTDVGEVCVSLEQDGGATQISVSDTGPGLDDAAIAELFEPFRRIDATTQQEKGSGLGLSISRELVRAMGGRLEVESELGVGTTFSMCFDFEVLVAEPEASNKLPFETIAIAGEASNAVFALADVVEGLGVASRIIEDRARLDRDGVDLVFAFPDAVGQSVARDARRAGIACVDVRWLSDPKAYDADLYGDGLVRDGKGTDVLIQPFSPTTVRQLLEDIAAGTKRTSTIDRWRGSMAEHFPASILIAEDDTTSQQVIVGMLERLGYAPKLVATGPQAVEALDANDFDIGLLDLHLPGFGGVGILERVPNGQTWWIAMSASSQPEQRRACREAGFRDFLSKPLTADGLRSALVRGAKRDSNVVDMSRKQAAPHRAGPARAGGSQLRDLFSSSPEAYANLLRSHIAQTDLLCADIEKGLAPRGDTQTARRAAHTLRSNSGGFGSHGVARHAQTLDSEWDELGDERRREIARKLVDAWKNQEREALVDELAALGDEEPAS